VAAEAEMMASKPVDPIKLVGLLGRLAILERLLACDTVSIELIHSFFGADQPAPPADDAEPVPAATSGPLKDPRRVAFQRWRRSDRVFSCADRGRKPALVSHHR
jgi:hypothetical protein